MKVSGSLKGRDSIVSSLKELPKMSQKAAILVIKEGLLAIHSTAVKSIQEHRSKGRTYKRGSVTHVASKPGNPPNSDTGRLAQSVAWQFNKDTLEGRVGTNLEYGAILELSPKGRRPWLKPAFDQHIGDIVKRFEAAILDGLKRLRR